jgi:hypothetical protein
MANWNNWSNCRLLDVFLIDPLLFGFTDANEFGVMRE